MDEIDVLLRFDGLDVNKADDDKLTALDYAKAAKLVRIVRVLEEHGGKSLAADRRRKLPKQLSLPDVAASIAARTTRQGLACRRVSKSVSPARERGAL